MKKRNYVLDGLMGVAVGDALGVPVEFSARSARKNEPVTDMTGHGTYNQPKGTWSDDSSLTFCLAESLCGGYDLRDIGNGFVKWYRLAYWSARGEVFDIGNATREAIGKLERGKLSPEKCGGVEENDNGNGSLMRILPLAFLVKNMPEEEKYKKIAEVSSLTHAHIRSVIGCSIYIDMALNLMSGMNREDSYNEMKKTIEAKFGNEPELSHYDRILKNDISKLSEDEIKTEGYVVYTIEAALWCFLNEDSYEKCVLRAVNLGKDTDTTGAVAGGLAGLYYGAEKIPEKWLKVLAKKDEITALADRLYEKTK